MFYLKINYFIVLFVVYTCSPLCSIAQEVGYSGLFRDEMQGRRTASGELYDMNKLTAAHKRFAFGSTIKVTRLDNQRSVIVRVNDRGPYQKGKIVELSRFAAREIGLTEGEVKVKVELILQANDNEDIRPPKPAPVADTPDRRGNKSKLKKKNVKLVSSATAEKAVVIPSKTTFQAEKKERTAVAQPAASKTPIPKSQIGGDLYKIQLSKPDRSGFGLQVAAMSNMKNVLAKVARLQENGNKNILICSEVSPSGKTTFKIIIGPFIDIASAEFFKKNLKKKKMTGFILNLATMERITTLP
ncbi:MAG: septal ring lytic transglycosylase RlpA family protein [Saprospiraceae bacterium]